MPKKSKKSLSKRVKLKDKFKVVRKVKEHHRKQRKEAKKLGKRKPSVLKDPGVPAAFPYRDQVVKELKFEQQRILATEAARKAAKTQRRRERQLEADGSGAGRSGGGLVTAPPGSGEDPMQVLQARAASGLREFHGRLHASNADCTSGDLDGSRRSFFNMFKKVVEASDVLLQVLDARDPLACRAHDIEAYIRSVDANKRIVLVLNKIDLVPREVASAWLRYLREELPTVAFKAVTRKAGPGTVGAAHLADGQVATLEPSSGQPAGHIHAGRCLGVNDLLQLLRRYCKASEAPGGRICVGVVGLPNVGKSSLINSLKRTHAVAVGGVPGVTRGLQEVVLEKAIRLLDSPGVVFSGCDDENAAVLRGCVKVDDLPDPVAPVDAMLQRIPPRSLMLLYSLPAFRTAEEFLALLAMGRGRLRRGGRPDTTAAARLVLHDWVSGRIPFFTRPPERGNQEHTGAAVVPALLPEFDADAVFANEASAVIAGLPTLADAAGFVEVSRMAPPTVMGEWEAASEIDVVAACPEDVSDMEDACDDSNSNDEDTGSPGPLGDKHVVPDETGFGDALPSCGMGLSGMQDTQVGVEEETGSRSRNERSTRVAVHSANKVLYGASGQHNPKLAKAIRRAERKQRLKACSHGDSAMVTSFE